MVNVDWKQDLGDDVYHQKAIAYHSWLDDAIASDYSLLLIFTKDYQPL
ncbi:MAG: hypothetical protein V7L31_27275 [Nostoc sp.]